MTWIDEDADIAMVFVLVEEENKETNEKASIDADEVFERPNSLMAFDPFKIKSAEFFYCKILYNLYSPGKFAPPPDFS